MQSKYFDRGRHATGNRGRSRRLQHCVCGRARLGCYIRLSERAQFCYCCHTRGFGITIACAGDLATTLVGTPGLGAVPENVFGTASAFAKGYGVILAIICALPCDFTLAITCAQPCHCRHKKVGACGTLSTSPSCSWARTVLRPS